MSTREIHFRAMGSQMTAMLSPDASDAEARLRQVPRWFEAWEQTLSRFRPDSPLSRLNQAGEGAAVSETLWEVLQASLAAAEESGGMVVPTQLAALETAGYSRSFERVQAGDTEARSVETPACSHWQDIRCGAIGRTVALPAGMRLDLAGVAKGWAADRAASQLGGNDGALVDAGGDVAVHPSSSGFCWPIGVADPHRAGSALAVLRLSEGGVATSGRDYHKWKRGGEWMHHIIDPRTGRPARTDVVTATVIAPSALIADVAAKTALIMGSRRAVRWLDQKNLGALLVLEDGRVDVTTRFEQHLWR